MNIYHIATSPVQLCVLLYSHVLSLSFKPQPYSTSLNIHNQEVHIYKQHYKYVFCVHGIIYLYQLVFLIACLAFAAVLLVDRVLGSGLSTFARAEAVDWVAVDLLTTGLVVGRVFTGEEVGGRMGERSDFPGDLMGDLEVRRVSMSLLG